MATHWAIYCPLGDKCNMGRKKINGWKTSEDDAKSALYQHLMSSAHELDDDEATRLVVESELETWGPSDKDKKRKALEGASEPAPQRRAIRDETATAPPAAASQAASSSSGSGGGQFTQLRLRAEQAEDTLYKINNVITRVVESMTKAVATMETAAQMARSAATAFDGNFHELKANLEAVQLLYSTAAPVRSMQFGV